ncbi:degenerin mec-10 [Trichonephila clavata]|uniref:Degenerin mec-10 n=1 Tax=Trichonephila clavata TaxID=2740835 RepID=A0A8X6H7R6_TRICU|nr:degenerin mec-10 [Trichonephila clavata]
MNFLYPLQTRLLLEVLRLELLLNAEINKYVAISHTVGFRIAIHDPFEELDPEGKGMNIIPGYGTNVLLRLTIIKRLSAPCKDHCVFYFNNKPFAGSQTQCIHSRVQLL